MKKLKIILCSLFFLITLTCCGKRNEILDMDILNASSTQSDNWYEESISVIADKALVTDKEECAKEIIQRVLDNSFHSIQFSFAKIEDGVEISMYPNELRVSVYTSKETFEQGKPAFKFEYVTEFNKDDLYDQNNIKDNPDSFQIVFRDV